MNLWVSEFGKISLGKHNQPLPGGHLQLCSDDFNALRNLLDQTDEDSPDHEKLFSYSRVAGQDRLTVRNYVGVIAMETGTQIEFLPKISKTVDPDSARSLLVKMLMELENSPFREGGTASLDAHRMPLFEILMRQFLNHTTDIARKGIARKYQSCRDNLIFLKGKLQLSQHIRLNVARNDRVYCEYDEYEANRPINRLIKKALEIVDTLTQDNQNQQLCRELLYWFGQVPASKAIQLDLARIQRDRLIQHYAPAMPSCKLILEGLNPLTKQGDRRTTALLFPMETVFENFVAAKLVSQFPDWRVHTQLSDKALVELHGKGRIFNLRPDLVMRKGTKRIVADTKWKLLNQADRSRKYGISQADMYQLFAYSKKFLTDQAIRETYLIYPLTQQFQMPLSPFWYRQEQEVLYVLPYDLEHEKLLLAPNCGLSPVIPKVAVH